MKKKIFLICITAFSMFSIFSQEKYGHVTPQTAEFMISGKFPVSMYTGKINISIPIYNIKDPDFDLPVSVSYNADGFKPNKNPGVVGYNWMLNAGGCITREVANIPDEHENVDNDIELGIHGFLTLSRLKTYNPANIYDFSTLVGQFVTYGIGNYSYFKLYDNTNTLMENYEYMPDVFSFNFCGKSGQFLIGNDGGVKLISEEWVDVDLDGVQSFQPQRSVFRCIPENIVSEIKLTDTNGYKYYFGGSNNAVEYTISVDCNTNGELRDNASYQQTTPTINAWHLTKIVAPNGREMNFHYIQPSGAGCYLKTDPLWQYSKNRTVEGVTTMSATKSAILEKISIPDIDFELNFTHTTQGTKKIYDNASDFNNLNYKLSSVIGTIDNDQLCNIGFEHDHFGGNSVWGYRFLKAINISNDLNPHKYQFTYDVENKTFPDPNLIGRQDVDDFGYWNSNNFLGLIKTITYPTGGVGEFTFERHDYGTKRYFEYKNINGIASIDAMIAYTAPMQIGGVRIKTIKNYISNELKDHVIYNYSSQFDLENSLATYNEQLELNSGSTNIGCLQTETNSEIDVIISLCRDSPGYQDEGIHSTGVFNSNHILVNDDNPKFIKSDSKDVYNIEEPHVGYREVTEINVNVSNGQRTYKTYSFTDYFTNPDMNASNFSSNIDSRVLYSYQNSYTSLSNQRGKILNEIWRSTSKNIVYELKNIYGSFDTNGFNLDVQNRANNTDHIVTLRNIGGFAITKKIYFSPFHIISKKTIEKLNGVSVEQLSNFEYDDKFRMVETSKLLSNGKHEFTEFKYPDQIIGTMSKPNDANLQGLYYLKKNNMISKPTEIINGISDNQGKLYSSSLITFYNKIITTNDTVSVPFKQYKLRVKSPVTSYSQLSINNDQLVLDSRMTESAEFQFSNKLRLTRIQFTGELPVDYVWDNKLMYPTSETQGDQTTTYIYKPMVGMSSKTDPRGVATFYYYDHLGRLISIKDRNNNLIQSFDYNFKNILNP